MMRALMLLISGVLALPALAQQARIVPWVTGEKLLGKLAPVSPQDVPWTPQSGVSREELAAMHTQTNIEYARGYIDALHDATEGRVWCYSEKHQVPTPATFWDESRWALGSLSDAKKKHSAYQLLSAIWRAKWAVLDRTREEAMTAPFEAIRAHFPDTVSITREELLQWIGRGDLIPDANFANTCAIRLSMALLGAGYPNPGVWPVLGGKFKGRAIETKQRKLSNWLAHQLGQPEKYKGGAAAKKGVGARHGIISFFQLHGPGDRQGHIDIIMMDRWNRYQRCGNNNDDAGGCFWDAVDVWFWPLK